MNPQDAIGDGNKQLENAMIPSDWTMSDIFQLFHRPELLLKTTANFQDLPFSRALEVAPFVFHCVQELFPMCSVRAFGLLKADAVPLTYLLTESVTIVNNCFVWGQQRPLPLEEEEDDDEVEISNKRDRAETFDELFALEYMNTDSERNDCMREYFVNNAPNVKGYPRIVDRREAAYYVPEENNTLYVTCRIEEDSYREAAKTMFDQGCVVGFTYNKGTRMIIKLVFGEKTDLLNQFLQLFIPLAISDESRPRALRKMEFHIIWFVWKQLYPAEALPSYKSEIKQLPTPQELETSLTGFTKIAPEFVICNYFQNEGVNIHHINWEVHANTSNKKARVA